jgi:hypothetical protein
VLVAKIVLLEEARRRFEAEDEWWRGHRDAKELFIEEFAQAEAAPWSAGAGITSRQSRFASAERCRTALTSFHQTRRISSSSRPRFARRAASGGRT